MSTFNVFVKIIYILVSHGISYNIITGFSRPHSAAKLRDTQKSAKGYDELDIPSEKLRRPAMRVVARHNNYGTSTRIPTLCASSARKGTHCGTPDDNNFRVNVNSKTKKKKQSLTNFFKTFTHIYKK